VLADVLEGSRPVGSPDLAPGAANNGSRSTGASSPIPKSSSIKLGDPGLFATAGETAQNNFHFAFLDYYQKHYVAAEETAQTRPQAEAALGMPAVAAADKEAQQSGATSGQAEGAPLPGGLSPLGIHRTTGSVSPRRRAPWNPSLERIPGDGTPMPPPPLDAKVSPGKHLKEQREAAEIKQLLGSIRPFEEPEVLVRICERLMKLIQAQDSHLNLVTQYGAVPIVEMLQVTDPTLLCHVLKVVNQIVERNQSFQEIFAMVGLIPAVIKFARPHHSRPLRSEAACFVWSLCNTSARSLQMLVACGGLEALVDLVSHDYYRNRDLVWLGLQALEKVFESTSKVFDSSSPLQSQKSSDPQVSQKSDFCRILAKHGLCLHLTLLVDTLACDIHNRAAQYLKVVVKLLLLFAKEGDAVVKIYMAKGPVLEGLIASLEFLPPELTVQICKIFKWLAQEPAVLNMLENAGVVPVLVHFLSLQCGQKSEETPSDPKMQSLSTAPGTLTPTSSESHEACKQCLLALHFLCKLSRPRQEQAALAGVVPLLQVVVDTRKDLREFAFTIFCSMTCASLASRKKLWDQGGVAFLVRSLAARDLQTPAEEALVDWLGAPDWCTRVETELLQEGVFLARLLELFRVQRAEADVFVKFLDPLLKFVRISRRIKDAVVGSDEFFQELLNRLRSEHKLIGGSSMEAGPGGGNFNSMDGLTAGKNAAPPEPAHVVEALEAPDTSRAAGAPASRVRRLVSEPAVSAGVDVRVRMYLMQLLLLLCKDLTKEQLAALNRQHRLQMLLHHVLQEEQRKQRVITQEIAQQLVSLFKDVAS